MHRLIKSGLYSNIKKTVFPLNIEAVVNKRKTVLIFIKIVYLTLNIYKIMVLRLSMLRVNMWVHWNNLEQVKDKKNFYKKLVEKICTHGKRFGKHTNLFQFYANRAKLRKYVSSVFQCFTCNNIILIIS